MYADIESGAATIRGYDQMSVPGLVQSVDFIRTLIELDKAEGSELDYVPERSIEARLRRQQAVFRPGGPHCEIILDEFVLRRLAVPASAMMAQLRYMVELLTREPRFTILILPLDARISPGRLPASSYTIYTYPDAADPPMVIAETTTNLVHTAPQEVAKYEQLYDRLRQATLPALESRSLLADTADRLSRQVGPEK